MVPEDEADQWLGVPCLDLGVQAVYERHAVEPPTWFGRLYRETLVRRLVAAEHTALLTRDERDRLQQRFSKPNPQPWEPNLLSATPTLELGIDVGDLSTVVLCSVPPAQANYLQRIGRAGRRDGNAFTATVATGQPHDLYFYAEPLAMLAGRIDPPGVFLNAPAVLERQLTAFCLDGWAATGLPDDAVPRTLRHVLDNVEHGRLTGFPYPFFDFVQRHGDDLLETFCEALAGELSGDSRDYLTTFLHGDAALDGDDEPRLSLRFRMVNRFHEIVKERKALRADVDALGRRIQVLKRAPQDEATTKEIKRLTRERGGLQGLLRKLNGRETFNFLTDEGLLPNYAFPEAGVTLKSVIYRSREQDEEDAADEQGDGRNVYAYVRPAASALSELAPENEFSAGGNRVRIDRIDLRVSPIETWRLGSFDLSNVLASMRLSCVLRARPSLPFAGGDELDLQLEPRQRQGGDADPGRGRLDVGTEHLGMHLAQARDVGGHVGHEDDDLHHVAELHVVGGENGLQAPPHQPRLVAKRRRDRSVLVAPDLAGAMQHAPPRRHLGKVRIVPHRGRHAVGIEDAVAHRPGPRRLAATISTSSLKSGLARASTITRVAAGAASPRWRR